MSDLSFKEVKANYRTKTVNMLYGTAGPKAMVVLWVCEKII